MIDILTLPPIMGLFCTGLVLHRAWVAWARVRNRRVLAAYRLRQIDRIRWMIHDQTIDETWKTKNGQ